MLTACWHQQYGNPLCWPNPHWLADPSLLASPPASSICQAFLTTSEISWWLLHGERCFCFINYEQKTMRKISLGSWKQQSFKTNVNAYWLQSSGRGCQSGKALICWSSSTLDFWIWVLGKVLGSQTGRKKGLLGIKQFLDQKIWGEFATESRQVTQIKECGWSSSYVFLKSAADLLRFKSKRSETPHAWT